MSKYKIKSFISRSIVPIMFLAICIAATFYTSFSTEYIISEVVRRLIRNSFLVLSLILPILAGMGINFGMTLGAMAGQIGLIFVTDWGITGVPGLFLAAAVGTPIAILLGNFSGRVLNRARGREMITSMMLAFFISGVYQFFLLYLCGSIIPFRNKRIILSKGYGVKNALKLNVAKGFDNLIKFKIGEVEIALFTIILIVGICLFTLWFKKTKLGQDMRAVGQDSKVADNAGINTDKIRIKSIVISTVLACYGQIIYLQNIGTINTYTGADQAALFAAAALLVGGATVSKASIANAIIGTALFHFMFIVMPAAGTTITGNATIGEYFRTFVSYGVVTIALILHAWNRNREKELNRKTMRLNAKTV